MTEYTTKYILKHKNEFCVCRFCSIINVKTAEICWICGIPTLKGYCRDIKEEDLTPLRKLDKATVFIC